MTERKRTTIKLFDANMHELEGPLADLIKNFEELVSEVPEEFRDLVELEFTDDWDGGWDAEISYDRLETDLEVSARAQAEEGRRTARERKERAQLAELKRKYPNDL